MVTKTHCFFFLFMSVQLEGSRNREHQVLARMRSISELRQAEEKASGRIDEAEKARWTKQKQEDENDEEERRMRSEILRRQRSNEAQTLIKQRSIDARAIFEQNTSAGQLSVSRRSSSSNSMSSPSPTPGYINNGSKVGAKWPPQSPSATSPTPVSPVPTSPTPPVIHQQSIPTNFYANNNRSNGASSEIPVAEMNNKRNLKDSEAHNSPIITPPAPADFADVPCIPSSPPPSEDPPAPAPTSPALEMLKNANNHQTYNNHDALEEADEHDWETPAINGSNPATNSEIHTEHYIEESEAQEYGIRARALYDYQAGKNTFVNRPFYAVCILIF